jgi:hypothetical protein
MQMPGAIVLAYLAASGLWTASDPFVGKWKLDPARSKTVDQMQIEAAGANTYAFKFEGGPAETVVANGADQPGVFGTTLAATIQDAHNWTIVRKQAGQVVITAHWKLAEDGKTLRDSFNGVPPFGSGSTETYVYRRTAGKTGVPGVWESTDPKPTAYEMEIRPNGAQGLSFLIPAAKAVKNVTFDGQDHPAGSAADVTASGRRIDDRALEITDKAQGKLTDARSYKLSPDGKTLTLTLHLPGQSSPNVLVFERE